MPTTPVQIPIYCRTACFVLDVCHKTNFRVMWIKFFNYWGGLSSVLWVLNPNVILHWCATEWLLIERSKSSQVFVGQAIRSISVLSVVSARRSVPECVVNEHYYSNLIKSADHSMKCAIFVNTATDYSATGGLITIFHQFHSSRRLLIVCAC